MKFISFLKILVLTMTIVLIVGFGFIVYGLVTKSSQLTGNNLPKADSLQQQVPEDAEFISYHFHGNTITILYRCGDRTLLYSIYDNGRKNIEIVKGMKYETVENRCSISEQSS